MSGSYDVVVLGGGLAGLTCALQLRQSCPEASVLVLERRTGPAPAAIHKVGESTVEIGAHYFGHVLGLESHLREQHLRKFGFRFFHSDGRCDIDAVQEIGVSRYLTVPSYQIDRGIFENFLAARIVAAGASLVTGAVVESVELATSGARVPVEPPLHRVHYCEAGRTHVARARWVVDGSGRAAILKRKLGLAEDNGHDANAVWFRVPVRLDVEDWSESEPWLGRCEAGQRWRSTNHLVGEGYWVWLIPLSSGFHSVGIVADATCHRLGSMNTYERALEWLGEHQPRLAQALLQTGVKPADFAFLRGFSYGCRETMSSDRWALTGEAGVFLDPFYSPGSDFIAIANTYIVDLISKDVRGEALAPHVRIYSQLFRSFYESTMTLYRGQYVLFGEPELLAVKVIWDYTYYWGILCQLFFQNRLTDLSMLGRVRTTLLGARALNDAMQDLLRELTRVGSGRNPPRLLDQAGLPWFAALNRNLTLPLDDAGFVRRVSESALQLELLAAEIVGRAIDEHAPVASWPQAERVIGLMHHAPLRDGRLLEYPLSA